ncbi:MAG: rod shape-determining protein RodA [Spirochaetes bacterium]|nr:rod shape-determining protein RodA [Spirochaetota bacterium]
MLAGTKPKRALFIFDYLIFFSMLFLLITGVLAVYSANFSSPGSGRSILYIKQIIFAVIGLGAVWIMMFISYIKIAEQRIIIYGIGIALLVLVLIPHVGRMVNGSRSWLFGVQPAEFVKLLMILVFSGFVDAMGDEIKTLRGFFKALAIAGVPMALILIQPDFGTFLVYVPITLVILFIAGARLRYLVGLIAIGVIGLSVPMFLSYSRMVNSTDNVFFIFFSHRSYIMYLAFVFMFFAALLFVINLYANSKKINRVAYIFFVLFLSVSAAVALDAVLKEYQKQRLLVFINPELKKLSSGYNIIQSLIAIGAGGFFGRGFLKGSQSQLDFIPQQMNDFVFSNIGEEWGFVGAGLVLLAFFLITFRGARIAYQSKDKLGAMIAGGITTMFLFHTLVNIGMVMGIMPITGIPLPFVSAGGSSLITSAAAVGVLFNIDIRRYVHGEGS